METEQIPRSRRFTSENAPVTERCELCPRASPRVRIKLEASRRGLSRVDLALASGRHAGPPPADCAPVLRQAMAELEEYFSGVRRQFTVPLDREALGCGFDAEVWRELERVPFGELWSYGELARRAGHPHAARAVGAAVGRNPLPIIVPCHRIIGSNGRLTGFSAGLELKVLLLELEGFSLSAASRAASRRVMAAAASPGVTRGIRG